MYLKPCPFCGSAGELYDRHWLGTFIVQCSNGTCPASFMIGWDYDTVEEAIEAWNTRYTSGWRGDNKE